MKRAELIEWLRTYTPFELEFRRLYEIYHNDIPETEFRKVLVKYGNDRDVSGTETFRNIDAAVSADAQLISDRFSDVLWLGAADNVSVRKHPRYFPENRHSHSFIELAYVVEGQCTQTFFFSGSDRTEKVIMDKGSLCIITPGIEHSIRVFDDSIVINILVRTSTLSRGFHLECSKRTLRPE